MSALWEPLLGARKIAARVQETGARIGRDYAGGANAGGGLVLVGVLDGGLPLLADLARAIPLPSRLATVRTRSYAGGLQSSGQVEMLAALDLDIAGRDVIVIDDVVDSGRTLAFLKHRLGARRPRSLAFACLLIKEVERVAAVEVRYGLFKIPNRFVVGYGLDLAGWGRGLPGVWALKEGASEDAALHELRTQVLG